MSMETIVLVGVCVHIQQVDSCNVIFPGHPVLYMRPALETTFDQERNIMNLVYNLEIAMASFPEGILYILGVDHSTPPNAVLPSRHFAVDHGG